MATVYKKISAQAVTTRQIPLASADDKTKASNIVNNFVNLFKLKHLP